jgi:FkbM family methyltransferase
VTIAPGRFPPRGQVVAGAARLARHVWEHPANEGQRVRSLLRLARFQARSRLLHTRSIAPLGDRSRLWVDLHRRSAAMVLYANPPDFAEMRAWQRVLTQGCLFIDVGANVGSYSIWAAERGAEVIAIEPAGDTFALLVENVALNGYQVRTIRAAAGASCGTARFTAGQDTVNRLDPQGPVETPLVTIDSVVADRVVAGLKIDVEGFEIEVLRGCARALSEQRIRLIQLEWNLASEQAVGTDRQPVADLLAAHGYGLYRPERDGRLVPIDDTGYGADIFARPARGDGER